MAVRLYVPMVAGTELDLFIDPFTFVKADDETRLLEIAEFQALSDAARTEVAICKEFGTLAAFDAALQDEQWDIEDRIDYYSYDDRTENLTVRDGAWFTPDSVDSFCGETGANVVGNSIDGSFGTFWRHSVDERHSVIYKLRNYPKKVARIRFRYNSTEPVTEQLSNLDVHAAKNLANIDEAENILETGINISWPVGQGSIWVEHTLAQKKNKARYIKLLFDTAHASNTSQIREFAVRVETRDP